MPLPRVSLQLRFFLKFSKILVQGNCRLTSDHAVTIYPSDETEWHHYTLVIHHRPADPHDRPAPRGAVTAARPARAHAPAARVGPQGLGLHGALVRRCGEAWRERARAVCQARRGCIRIADRDDAWRVHGGRHARPRESGRGVGKLAPADGCSWAGNNWIEVARVLPAPASASASAAAARREFSARG